MKDTCITAGELRSREAPLAAIGRFVRTAVARISHEARVRRDQRYLGQAPDYILKDLGIHRSEISAVTRLGRERYRRGASDFPA